MADTHHITDMVPRMREGDDEAADVLWQQFFSRLVGYARRKLDGLSRAATGEEDVRCRTRPRPRRTPRRSDEGLRG
ncbi:MAG: ECF-type sigma factor, partial [Pirellulaceae bacterium]